MLRWPEPDQLLQQVQVWASELQKPRLCWLAVGMFCSYGRGPPGLVIDLDLRDLRWMRPGL